jgi:predicted esterase
VFRLILALIINSFLVNSWASNEIRELEYAEEIVSSLKTGGIVWLRAEDKKFLALYIETEKKTNSGTAIILHAKGSHPNQKNLINPLRIFLPRHNWATLSMQMPVLETGAKNEDYFPIFENAQARIQAGIEHLKKGGVQNIVLIGYGLGGMMALYFLQENENAAEIKALVTISLGVPDTANKNAQTIDFISEIKQDFLDVFAANDLANVTKSARKRRIAGKSNSDFRQLKIEGAGHLFQNNQDLLVKRIYSWMNLRNGTQ